MCYRKPTRDDHTDTVYSQLKVFTPAGWYCPKVFGDPSVALSIYTKELFKSKNHLLVSLSVPAGGGLHKQEV